MKVVCAFFALIAFGTLAAAQSSLEKKTQILLGISGQFGRNTDIGDGFAGSRCASPSDCNEGRACIASVCVTIDDVEFSCGCPIANCISGETCVLVGGDSFCVSQFLSAQNQITPLDCSTGNPVTEPAAPAPAAPAPAAPAPAAPTPASGEPTVVDKPAPPTAAPAPAEPTPAAVTPVAATPAAATPAAATPAAPTPASGEPTIVDKPAPPTAAPAPAEPTPAAATPAAATPAAATPTAATPAAATPAAATPAAATPAAATPVAAATPGAPSPTPADETVTGPVVVTGSETGEGETEIDEGEAEPSSEVAEPTGEEEEEEEGESSGVCVDAKLLSGFASHELVFDKHYRAAVLCDSFDNCATKGHIVHYKGTAMMMGSYCDIVGCKKRVMEVNSPIRKRGLKVDTKSDDLKFTAFAARYETKAEEYILSTAVHMGL